MTEVWRVSEANGSFQICVLTHWLFACSKPNNSFKSNNGYRTFLSRTSLSHHHHHRHHSHHRYYRHRHCYMLPNSMHGEIDLYSCGKHEKLYSSCHARWPPGWETVLRGTRHVLDGQRDVASAVPSLPLVRVLLQFGSRAVAGRQESKHVVLLFPGNSRKCVFDLNRINSCMRYLRFLEICNTTRSSRSQRFCCGIYTMGLRYLIRDAREILITAMWEQGRWKLRGHRCKLSYVNSIFAVWFGEIQPANKPVEFLKPAGAMWVLA